MGTKIDGRMNVVKGDHICGRHHGVQVHANKLAQFPQVGIAFLPTKLKKSLVVPMTTVHRGE